MPHEKKHRSKGNKSGGILKIKPPHKKGFSPHPACEAPNIEPESSPGKAQKMDSMDSFQHVTLINGSEGRIESPVEKTSSETEEVNNNTSGETLPGESTAAFHRNKEGIYECNFCTFVSPYYSGIMSHALIHMGESPYVCKVCGFTTERRGLMVIHMRMHKGFKPHKCHLCDYSTLQEMHLKVHLRTHNQERPFKCQGCSYRCSSREILKIHMNKYEHHTRIFKCDVCDYTTMRKHNLIQHTTIHTGSKPFKCELCPYQSSQKGHLNVHIRTHTREKPFKCNFCPFASTVPKSLREHLQMHIGKRPLQCPYCSFSSSQAFSIKRHISLHEEVKKFTCNLCTYSTTIEDDYITHRTIHSSNRNYRCPKCTYESPFRHVFREHLKIHKSSKRANKLLANSEEKLAKKSKKDHPTLEIEFDEFKQGHTNTDDEFDDCGFAENSYEDMDSDDGNYSDSDVAPFRLADSWGENGNGVSIIQEEKHLQSEEKPKSPKQKAAIVSKQHIASSFVCKYCSRSLIGQETWRRHVARHFQDWPEIE